MNKCKNGRKTSIAVLASHDSEEKNMELVRLFDDFCDGTKTKDLLENFHFVFTGGTFNRVLLGTERARGISGVRDKTRKCLLKNCDLTCLPSRLEGGVTILSYLIVQQQCSIVWPFLSPLTSHWLSPENLALIRLCDHWHVKKLMNSGSVREWIENEAQLDITRNCQDCPLKMKFIDDHPVNFVPVKYKNGEKYFKVKFNDDEKKNFHKSVKDWTIALIAHDGMKSRMIEFAIDHEQELAKFKRILSTGTTGREVSANTRTLGNKVKRYRSGPKGGDIEIATEILFGRCHVVIFFIDPLNPHPHIEDIRVVLGSCMLRDNVRMFTNEMQARDWMQRVVRG